MKLLFSLLATCAYVFMYAPSVLAQDGIIQVGIQGCDFLSGQIEAKCIPYFIAHTIGELFKFTGALCIIMIMYGGFEYTLDKLAGGKERGIKRIQHGILGMVVSAFAFFIVKFFISAIQGV